jgi:hypothetical protein
MRAYGEAGLAEQAGGGDAAGVHRGPSGHRRSSLRSASSASKSPPETALNDDRALSLATTMPT